MSNVSIPKWCDCKRGGGVTNTRAKEMFQFLNGAIVSADLYVLECASEVSIPKWCDCKWRKAGAKDPNSILFQFLNGAIVRILFEFKKMPCLFVSIPKWCDCKIEENPKFKYAVRVSIPKWCDCKGTAL